jgi:hypothetical protein
VLVWTATGHITHPVPQSPLGIYYRAVNDVKFTEDANVMERIGFGVVERACHCGKLYQVPWYLEYLLPVCITVSCCRNSVPVSICNRASKKTFWNVTKVQEGTMNSYRGGGNQGTYYGVHLRILSK